MLMISLAIALHKVSIPCTVYESRSKPFNLGGGIMLSPNALGVLDSLGVYERIRNQGFNFDVCEFKNANGETTDTYYFGSEKLYGYQALRIYRQILMDELLLMLEERGISVKYAMKFTHVISESRDEVVFGFADRSTASASLLIGADGIHSRVLVGTQRVYKERDRAGWEEMLAGQGELLAALRKDLRAWPDVVQSALENVSIGKINIWPFYGVPKLEWASAKSKVIILGDAAHAIPPTAGQGVNQAFEEIYMLALLLSKLSPKTSLPEALSFWQEYRPQRIDKALDLTRQMNAKRLPPAEQAKVAAGLIWKEEDTAGEGGQLRWLYEPALDRQVSSWIQEREGQRVSNRA
ncbi:hypothetical protein MMC30_005319 [Trapelia coarctata]|nr:hypothetical protein [Trapelia coarctata]